MGDNYDLSITIASIINSTNRENKANIPDYIIGDFLVGCLEALEAAVKERDRWYGIDPAPGYPTRLKDSSDRPIRTREQ